MYIYDINMHDESQHEMVKALTNEIIFYRN